MIPLGGENTFTCTNRATTENVSQFQWLVNGTLVEELNLGDRITTDHNNHVGYLHFINITENYNNTIIQCRVNLTSGDITFSDNATLLVQGESVIIYFSS